MFPTIHGIVNQIAGGEAPPVGTEYGIATLGTLGNASSANQVGWVFQVDASPITADRLRAYSRGAATETVRLWDVHSRAELAQATITSIADQWVEETITPVVLKPNHRYAVTMRAGSRNIYSMTLGDATLGPGIAAVRGCQVSGTGFPTGDFASALGVPDTGYGEGGADQSEHAVIEVGDWGASSAVVRNRGWEFTVGADDLDVTALRVTTGADAEVTLSLWRTSDQSLLASVDVDAIANQTVEGAITPVTLQAGEDYVLTALAGSFFNLSIPAEVVFNTSRISFLRGRFNAAASNTFPTSTSGSGMFGFVDMTFTVAT